MKVSVVITTYNRSLQLTCGLATLFNQTRLPDEIILVDDGSTDDTKSVAEHYLKRSEAMGISFKYVYLNFTEPRISCIPRNEGWRMASHDYIIFTEPEALQIDTNIENLIKKAEANPSNTILASQVWTMGEKIYKKLKPSEIMNPKRILKHEYAMLTDESLGYNTKAPNSDWAISGESNCNAGVLFLTKKGWLEKINGFDESFEGHGFDDFDLFNRLAIIGHGILKDPTIPVIHQWHEKNYPYNIYDMAEKNGRISEENVKKGRFRVNENNTTNNNI